MKRKLCGGLAFRPDGFFHFHELWRGVVSSRHVSCLTLVCFDPPLVGLLLDGGRGGDRGRGRDRDRGRDGGSGKRKPTREPSTATEDEYSYFYEYRWVPWGKGYG